MLKHFNGQSDEVPSDSCAVFIDEEPGWDTAVSRRFMALVEASSPSPDGGEDLRSAVTIIPGGERLHSSHYLPEGWTLEYTDNGLPEHSLPYEYGLIHEDGSDIRLVSFEDGPPVDCVIHRLPPLEPPAHALAWLVAKGPDSSQLLLTLQPRTKKVSRHIETFRHQA